MERSETMITTNAYQKLKFKSQLINNKCTHHAMLMMQAKMQE